MSSAHHYYLTFNPYLNKEYENGYTQAHEFYDFLKERVSKDKKATAYWGKIIAKDRNKNANLESFQKVLQENKENGFSTHLYITDFQNIWVGKVKSVKAEIPSKKETLHFYHDKKVEIWFEVEDFILTHHSPEETASKMSELYIDNDFNDLTIQGMSPFTTSVRYPCILQDIAEEQYFDEFDRDECSHLILKENPAISKSNIDHTLKVLHTYVFPEEMYAKIPHAAKLEIESAEMDILENRNHNTHKIAFSYLRALEVVLNDLIIHHIKRKGFGEDFFVDATSAPPRLYLNPTKDYYIPLKQHNKNFSITAILNFVERAANHNHLEFKKAFSDHKQFIRYLTKELAGIVKDNSLVDIRNFFAHGEMDQVSYKDAVAVRHIILGIGTPGLIHMCYKTFFKDKFSALNQTSKKKDSSKEAKKNVLKLVG